MFEAPNEKKIAQRAVFFIYDAMLNKRLTLQSASVRYNRRKYTQSEPENYQNAFRQIFLAPK